MRLSRLVRETLEKLPLPEDVLATVDVDLINYFSGTAFGPTLLSFLSSSERLSERDW
jgi:hypothetical protein